MTFEELKKIPFRFVSHLSMEDETGHHTPLCQLRAQYNITVTGNKFEGV